MSPWFFLEQLVGWHHDGALQLCLYISVLEKAKHDSYQHDPHKKKIGFLWPNVLLANVPPSQMTSAAAVKGNARKSRWCRCLLIIDVFGFHVSLRGHIFQDSTLNGFKWDQSIKQVWFAHPPTHHHPPVFFVSSQRPMPGSSFIFQASPTDPPNEEIGKTAIPESTVT